MPNRSASRMTITVALGTSTPTSMTVVATSTSRRPLAELVHGRLLVGRAEAPVQQPEAQALELAGGQLGEGVLGRADLELVGLLDQRGHDVRLAPGGHLAAHRGPHLGLVVLGAGPGGDDRLAPGGPRADHRDVEVAVDRHGRRARDRRRRHDQDVGHRAAAGLVPQGGPLLDAEAVLLVDDDRAERGEVDALLDEGVGADGDVDLAGGQPGEDAPPVGGARPCWSAARPAPAGRRTATCPASGTSTSSSSARMPRACCSASTSVGAMNAPWWPPSTAASSVHTATTVLPAPTSPCSSRCIGWGAARSPPISAIGRPLVGGEVERQPVDEGVEQRALGDLGDAAGRALDVPLALDQGELDPQQLVEHEPAAGHLLVGHRLGGVDAGERLGPGHQVVAVEHPLGHRVGQPAAGRPAQGLGHPVADLPGGQAGLLGLRVDGHDAARPVADEVDDRVGHLLAPVEQVDLAEQGHGEPLGSWRSRHAWLKNVTRRVPLSSRTSAVTSTLGGRPRVRRTTSARR